MARPTRGHPESIHPTQDDPTVRALSDAIGGPMGDRGAGHWWWTPLRVLLVLAALCFVAGMVQKGQCFKDPDASDKFTFSHLCYSDLPGDYLGRGLVELELPYSSDDQVRQRFSTTQDPVVVAYLEWGTAWLVHGLNGSPDLEPRYKVATEDLTDIDSVRRELVLFPAVTAVLLAGAALAITWLLTRLRPRRPWDAAIFAASPLLALTALISWDLIGVLCAVGALLAWERRRPVLVGVLLGLGTATTLYPALLLIALALVAWREGSRSRWIHVGLATVWTAAAWGIANAPAFLLGRTAWKHYWSTLIDPTGDLGSWWLIIQEATDKTFSTTTVTAWTAGLLVLWLVGVAALCRLASRPPRLGQVAFLVVAGFVLLHSVFAPQYVLWLLPLAALARARVRDQIVWQSGELFYFGLVWFYLGGYLEPAGGGDAGFYWVAIIVRILAELYLVVMVARDVLDPFGEPSDDDLTDDDPVEAGGGEADTHVDVLADLRNA